MDKQAKRRSTYLDLIETFLSTTKQHEVYRYLVTMIVAGHQPEVWTILLGVARREQNRYKVEILLEAFALVRNDPIVAELVHELQQKQ